MELCMKLIWLELRKLNPCPELPQWDLKESKREPTDSAFIWLNYICSLLPGTQKTSQFQVKAFLLEIRNHRKEGDQPITQSFNSTLPLPSEMFMLLGQLQFYLIWSTFAELPHCAPSALQDSIWITHTHFDHITALHSWQDPGNTWIDRFGSMVSL